MPRLMTTCPVSQSIASDRERRHQRRHVRVIIVLTACLAATAIPRLGRGQTFSGQLASREELTAAANEAQRAGNALQAAAIRQRLSDGDFQVGDRIVLYTFSDIAHTDTLVVRAGRLIDLPAQAVLPLAGVLRSELKGRVTAEVLKYIKAQQIEVTPLTRIGVFGEVARPGYFAFRSDAPITDVIMSAGGPTATADIERTIVKRGSREYRSADETKRAVAGGLTLDQFGLNAGDELVVGKEHQFPALGALVGMATSVAALFFALRR
jgi:protein involved in polysaccharide export with SLBB domain